MEQRCGEYVYHAFTLLHYFHITKLENDMTTYRQQLNQLFSQQYRVVTVLEQRISNQRRFIVRNKLLSQEILDQLREEVRLQLQEESEDNKL